MADKAVVTQTTLDAIGQAIIDKGGATEAMTPAQMPAAIQAIPSGDPYYNAWWNPLPGWPNLRKILDEDTVTGYSYKFAFLIPCFNDSIVVSGASAYRFSDGAFTTESGNHIWTDSPMESFYDVPLRWFVAYTNSEQINYPIKNTYCLWVCSNGNGYLLCDYTAFYSYQAVRCVEANIRCNRIDYLFMSIQQLEAVLKTLDLSTTSDPKRTFAECRSLRFVNEIIGVSGKNISNFFSNCGSLVDANWDVDISELEGNELGNCFTGNNSRRHKLIDIVSNGLTSIGEFRSMRMKKLTDRIILPNVTTIGQYMFYDNKCELLCDQFEMTGITSAIDSNTFSYMSMLKSVPPVFKISQSFAFTQNSFTAEYKGNFATFDDGGNLIGGMAYNMNHVSGLTATISATIKNFFTATEQAAIEAAFNAKGWTLAW